jgi:pyridoxamine 5'-phosphate oxidase
MTRTPWVSACFHWDSSERQARIEGRVSRVTPAESDAYFASREWEKKVGAWASDQSRPIASRDELLKKVAQSVRDLKVDLISAFTTGKADIPRPPHWGGFRLLAARVELWQGSTGRVHDRGEWTREIDDANGTPVSPWRATRLQP